MSDLILHHYWPSPFAHKIRMTLGMIGASDVCGNPTRTTETTADAPHRRVSPHAGPSDWRRRIL